MNNLRKIKVNGIINKINDRKLNNLSGMEYLNALSELLIDSLDMCYGGMFEVSEIRGNHKLKEINSVNKTRECSIDLVNNDLEIISHILQVENYSCLYSVKEFFYKDVLLNDINAESLLGSVFKDINQKIIGVYILIGNKKINNIRMYDEFIKENYGRINAEFDRVLSFTKMAKLETDLRYFVETSRDMIWEIDINGVYRYVNRASFSIYGYKQEEMIGHDYSEFMSIKAADEFKNHLNQSITGNGVYDVITEHITKNGDPLRMIYNTKPKYDDKGILTGFVGTTTDITESIRVRMAVKNNSEIFSEILSRLPVIFYRMDEKGCLREIRGSGLKRMGVDNMEWVGKPVYGLFLGMDKEIDRALSGETVHFRSKGSYKGKPWWFLTSIFFDNWRGLGAVGFSVDISEQVESEEKLVHLLSDNKILAQRLIEIQEDERRSLARELHDELGQSITAVKSLAKAITSNAGESYSEVRSLGNSIIDLSGRIYDSVNGIMRRLRPDILDSLGFKETLKSCIVSSQLEKMGINCNLQIIGKIDDLDEVVQITVYRIVQECLTNISKYAMASNVNINIGRDAIIIDNDNGIVLSDASMKEDDDKRRDILSVMVSDDGVGMDLENAFKRTKGKNKMGLQGIKERITALGGELAVKSKLGKGVKIIATINLSERLSRIEYSKSSNNINVPQNS
ncbi:MAG: PAS domain S-box protein [Gammaproteobacteria bacterium]|nr:PAS domain S-box protein [Gammaproteobacteria bacterium]